MYFLDANSPNWSEIHFGHFRDKSVNVRLSGGSVLKTIKQLKLYHLKLHTRTGTFQTNCQNSPRFMQSLDFISALGKWMNNKKYAIQLSLQVNSKHIWGLKNLVMRRTGPEKGERRRERLDICYGHSNTITNPKRAPFITLK